jgi:hypothetical protein
MLKRSPGIADPFLTKWMGVLERFSNGTIGHPLVELLVQP